MYQLSLCILSLKNILNNKFCFFLRRDPRLYFIFERKHAPEKVRNLCFIGVFECQNRNLVRLILLRLFGFYEIEKSFLYRLRYLMILLLFVRQNYTALGQEMSTRKPLEMTSVAKVFSMLYSVVQKD